MNGELAPFNSVPDCPKCGATINGRTYHSVGTPCGCDATGEHFRRICPECAYSMAEAVRNPATAAARGGAR